MSLTTTMGVKLAPIVLGTLFKHYLERNSVIKDSKARNELLFDQAFTVVKSFMEESSKHTVEELQQFSNTRIPAPPWVHCVRVLIPLSCCDEAAPLLLKALGGPEAVGGSKWWQVRGVRGVDAQWVAVKRDWREAERRRKKRGENRNSALFDNRQPGLFDGRMSGSSTKDEPSKGPTRHHTITGRSGREAASGSGSKEAKRSRPTSAHGVGGERAKPSEGVRFSQTSTLDEQGLEGDEDPKTKPIKEGQEEEAHYEPDMDDMRCMLYIHGGGYYFGSVDQQRYCMQRYARKMGGRVLAVNYRLAPQYPFPCALHDCLAAYLYLIRPPEGAEHLPVPPEMVIIAGDSAGGGMTLALLQIIRDVGLPAPAGGVLISPWCDLTHSFPSVLENTTTDIIPPYGLSLHKPSTLWPPPSEDFTTEVHTRMTERVREVVRLGKSKLGLGPPGASALDLSKLDGEAKEKPTNRRSRLFRRRASSAPRPSNTDTTALGDSYVEPPPGATLAPTADKIFVGEPTPLSGSISQPILNSVVKSQGSNKETNGHLSSTSPAPGSEPNHKKSPSSEPEDSTGPHIQLGPTPKRSGKRQNTVDPSQGEIALEINGERKVVRSQIQLYAQNHQLTHPLVSPALGYLGGLPPLFVLASDKEVLRDEIIYVAHKAAHPDRYPVKPESKERLASLKDIENKGYPPTLVHLQVYDETCHVLPLFSFTTPAKYCYRAISLFCKHVTSRANPSIPPTPMVQDATIARSPELEPALLFPAPGSRTPSSIGTPSTPPPEPPTSPRRLSITSPRSLTFSPSILRRRTTTRRTGPNSSPSHSDSPSSPTRDRSDDIAGPRFGFDKNEPPAGVGTAGDPSVYSLQADGQGNFESPFKDNMIRERVSTSGVLRPLEPESELAGCTMDLEDIGAINANSVGRYLQGQTLWDKKFAGTIKNITKERTKHLELARKEGRKSMGVLHGALANGSLGQNGDDDADSASSSLTFLGSSHWSMSWALDGENPPPSSIVSRRDTAEARRLAVCADRDLGDESKLSGNNLWSVVVDFLTTTPDRNAIPSDGLADDSSSSSTPNNFDINVQPPTPSSPAPPLPSHELPRKRSSTLLRKLMGRGSASDTPQSTRRRPLTLFVDSNRDPVLPVIDKS